MEYKGFTFLTILITVYISRRLEKSKQGRELKVINKLRNQDVESNGDSHPQFQDSQPVRLKRGTEGVK
ncbi:hypothetical protein B9T07_10055 [Limnospira fusiformis CCALA 023]